MSLYGDLPPPGASSDAANPTEQTKSSKDANTAGSSTVAKAALPAGWSSAVTRLKPMMNRKPAPPKPKLAARNIPAGFVSLTSPRSQVLTGAAIRSAAPLAPVAATAEVSVPVPATAPTADESRWLKERMAQVQRQDHESHTNLRKQTKRTPVKGHPGPISLDDDYDIARPNEYEELKLLFEHEQKLRQEENQRFQQHGTRQTLSQQRSMTRTRSFSRSPLRSRSESRSRSRSRTRSRSGSRRRQRSPDMDVRDHSPRSRKPHFSSTETRGSQKDMNVHPPLSPQDSSRHSSDRHMEAPPRGRSITPNSQRHSHARSRSASPSSNRHRRRTPSPTHRHEHSQLPSSGGSAAGQASSYKAFAPPPSLTGELLSTPSHGPERTNPVVTAPVTIMNDASGEDAFLRRARLSQQRSADIAAPSLPPPQPARQQMSYESQRHGTNVKHTSSKGPPSTVILLTNMVGPGEVDDTLQEETAVECEKYGSVVRCLIFEVQNGKVPAEEAVRIFVKFRTLSSAEKALQDLDGRFFGGRQVRGQFFDEKRFELLQLAP